MKSAPSCKSLQLLVVLWASIYSSSLFACPESQYEQCIFGSCVCLPKIGGNVGNAADKAADQVQSDRAANKTDDSKARNRVDIEKLPDPCKIRKLPECE